jgi:hypothetical protein
LHHWKPQSICPIVAGGRKLDLKAKFLKLIVGEQTIGPSNIRYGLIDLLSFDNYRACQIGILNCQVPIGNDFGLDGIDIVRHRNRDSSGRGAIAAMRNTQSSVKV